MLYLVSLGLGKKSISLEALEALKTCKQVFLESYTTNFPYSIKELGKVIKKKIKILKREDIEKKSDNLLKLAKKENIALLIYGDVLSATTHIDLILRAKKKKIKLKIFHSSSILTAIAETGLQLYKFGKVGNIPKWQKNFNPKSFYNILLENQKINAHTLFLADVDLSLKEALEQLQKTDSENLLKNKKIIVCSCLGTEKSKIFYTTIDKLKKKKVNLPFCLIIPAKLHFMEEKFLKVASQ